jgi:steroid 5-alpha reductase family enzyme
MILTLVIAFFTIFLINMLAYAVAFVKQTDHLTDITYSLSFFILAISLWGYFGDFGLYKSLLLAMILLWSSRLGAFLLHRISKMGKDERFDAFRENPKGFLKFWILQSISIWIISIPFIIGFSKPVNEIGSLSILGFSLWLIGWLLESVADWQKFTFRQDESKNGKFIQSGLFSRLRHPNYTGEILCWLGVFIYLVPAFSGLEWLSIISPLWIVTLLVFISGIPLLVEKHKEKYGHLKSYQEYVKKSWRLIPFVY